MIVGGMRRDIRTLCDLIFTLQIQYDLVREVYEKIPQHDLGLVIAIDWFGAQFRACEEHIKQTRARWGLREVEDPKTRDQQMMVVKKMSEAMRAVCLMVDLLQVRCEDLHDQSTKLQASIRAAVIEFWCLLRGAEDFAQRKREQWGLDK